MFVAPLVGVRIEITPNHFNTRGNAVAPLVGVRIEIDANYNIDHTNIKVAPLVGVRIEILKGKVNFG